MKEIREMNQTELEQLETEIRKEFLIRENEVNKLLKKEMEVEKQNSEIQEEGGYRGADEEVNYFDLSLTPQMAKTGLNMDNYIKIKGDMKNPSRFMNSLANKIKFKVVFEEKSEFEEITDEMREELKKLGIDDDEEVSENDKIKGNDTEIQIRLYKSDKDGYLLRYVRKEGNQFDFLDKMEKISSIVKNIL